MTWKTEHMPVLGGRTAVVTGANSGIGFETARELVRVGADVVLACRSPERGDDAARRIRDEIRDAAVEVMALDLASLDSIRTFARDFADRRDALHLLINNAGIMMCPYRTTEDGFEMQLGVNHLGHFALTGLLLEPLRRDGRARVVTVSSGAHRMGRMDFSDLMYDDGGYSPAGAYGRSKLANLLFAFELQRRLDQAGLPMQSMAVHPGVSETHLQRHIEGRWYYRLARPLMSAMGQSPWEAAHPTLRAATAPAAAGGSFYGPDGFLEMRGHPVEVRASESARDEASARKLWELSESLTGVRYDL